MKVLISHSQKQHSYHFAIALLRSHRLKKFYTSIFFPRMGKRSLLSNYKKKRHNPNINKYFVSRTYIPEILYQFLKRFDATYAAYVLDRIHDYIVAIKIKNSNYDCVVGYERQCLKTFKEAKRLGKTTILDLASIHPEAQKKLNEDYNNITTGFESSPTVIKNRRVKKDEYVYSDYVIVLSDYAKRTCIENGVDQDSIYNVKLGIDPDFFFQKNSYRKDEFEILFVAGVRYWKGIKDLVESFNELNLESASLTIIGYLGDAKDYVKNNVSEKIRHIPNLPQDQLRNYYQSSSIFVLPSYMDSWGQVVCEAMACGTPVIVTASTGASDIVKSGENGFVINVADKVNLQEKIRYFYKNRDEIERMGRNARKTVERLTWENYYKQINQVFLDIESR